ncbi:MAG: hypothetical protein HOO06_04050 [Bdellovibrionaceae bacterium]|jgi:hypothetical protein|nr:hypothetical protein [Pseudobdellovibrionaceae bacterium]
MNLFLRLFVFIIAFCGPRVYGLPSKSAFFKYTDNYWHFSCSLVERKKALYGLGEANDYYTKVMRREFPSIVYDALSRISLINPVLIDQIWKSNSKHKISFSCEGLELIESGAAADASSEDVRLGTTTILLPYLDSQRLAESAQELGGRLPLITSRAKQVIIHETLHVLSFDNFSSDIHNELEANNKTKESDVVYSCTAQGMDPQLPIAVPIFKNNYGAMFGNTVEACLTCAKARKHWWRGTFISKKNADAQNASQLCDRVQNILTQD